MAYATQTDLAERLAPELLVFLADDDGDGVADAAVISAALDDAAAIIDQAIGGRYVTPVASPPDSVIRWNADLAAANLFLRKREVMPAEQGERAREVRRELEAIAMGRALLIGATPRLLAFSSENTRRDDEKIFDSDALDTF